MPDNSKPEIDIEALQRLGKVIGAAYYAIQNGFLAGYTEEKQRQEEDAARERAESGTDHDPILEKCKVCWCRGCAAFEDCIVPTKGYAIESKPCPCDGCDSQRGPYMPKEKPPCNKYRPEAGPSEP